MKRNLSIFVFTVFFASTIFAAEWQRTPLSTRAIYDLVDDRVGHKRLAHVIVTFPKKNNDDLFEITVYMKSTEHNFKHESEGWVLAAALAALQSEFSDFPSILQGV